MKIKNKKLVNFMLYIFLILILVVITYFYFVHSYKYLVGSSLLDDTQLLFSGNINLDNKLDIRIDSNNLFGPFRNKKVKIDNINKVDYVYNTFKFTGFEPYKEYTCEFELYIKGLADDTKLVIGVQQTKGENHVDEETNQIITNIELENEYTFAKGYSDYISVELDFTANEEGTIYIVLGIALEDQKVLDYEMSHVRLVM